MRLRVLAAIALLAGVSVVGGGAGVAAAQPTPSPPAPSVIDQLITSTPALSVDPSNEGGQAVQRGTFGMICQNAWVKCR